MAYKVRCSACGKSMWLPESDAGLGVVCLACGTKFAAPPTDQRRGLRRRARRRRSCGRPSRCSSSTAVADRRPPPCDGSPGRRDLARCPWGVAAAVCAVLVLLSLGVVERLPLVRAQGRRQELATMLAEARTSPPDGDLRRAHQKYRELDRRATEIGDRRPGSESHRRPGARRAGAGVRRRCCSSPPRPGSQYGVARAAAGNRAAPSSPPKLNRPKPSPAPAPSPIAAPSNSATPRPPQPERARRRRRAGRHRDAPRPRRPDRTAAIPDRSATDAAARRAPLAPAHDRAGPPLRPMPRAAHRRHRRADRPVDPARRRLPDRRCSTSAPDSSPQSRRAGDEGYVCGLNALCVYALLQCGQAIPDQRLDVHGPFMKSLIEGMKRLPANDGQGDLRPRHPRHRAGACTTARRTAPRLRGDVTVPAR